MKLTSIQLHPEGIGDSSLDVELSFRDPSRSNPYNIKGVFGLDADSIIHRYYGVSGNQSNKYYNFMLEKRDIVLRIELNPSFANNESYSDLREKVYKAIASTRTGIIRVRFKNGSETTAIARGLIKKFEAPTSTKTPEIQITIECEDSMLKAPEAVSVDLAGFDPGYTILVDDLSTAPHGFKFVMDITAALDTMVIQDPTDLTWFFHVAPTGGFQPGDVVFFSSEVAAKEIYMERGGDPIHLADSVHFSSVWPIMFPGNNALTFSSSSLMNWRSITYFPTYWGV